MNSLFFERNLRELFGILDNSNLSKTEITYRKSQLKLCVDRIAERETREDYNRYNQLAHEIESYAFLKRFGQVKMSEDSKSQPGCDLLLSNTIYIECVCATAGDAEKSGLASYMGEGSFDYRKKRQLINERFISSLSAKVEFYNTHKNKSILPDKPYVIFLSPGSLIYEWFEEWNGMALLDVLLGKGDPTILVNIEKDEIRDGGYSHNSLLQKYNGAPLDCNLFLNQDFNCVSAILLSTILGERYSENNTFLFINPFATRPIEEGVFEDLIVWKSIDGKEYASYYGKKRLE